MEFDGSCTANHLPMDDDNCPPCSPKCYKPISYDQGAPVEYRHMRFIQNYKECIWQQDVDNEILKNRKFSLKRPDANLSQRPLADPCFPTKSMLKRNGKPPKFDGLNEIADNLKDVGVESDLIGLWGKQSKCQINDGINNDYCAEQGTDGVDDKYCRITTSQDIINIFNQTSINDEAYEKQLYTNFEEEKNINKASPHVFRNNSRAKLQRH